MERMWPRLSAEVVCVVCGVWPLRKSDVCDVGGSSVGWAG